jgi:hypothetical protein
MLDAINKFLEGKGPRLACSTLGSLLIPINLIGFMFFGFSFTDHESEWVWSFIQFADLWQIPAILLSFFFPRTAAIWLLSNILISVGIAHHINHCGCVTSSVIAHATVFESASSITSPLRLYGAEFLLAMALLWTTRHSWHKRKDDAREDLIVLEL